MSKPIVCSVDGRRKYIEGTFARVSSVPSNAAEKLKELISASIYQLSLSDAQMIAQGVVKMAKEAKMNPFTIAKLENVANNITDLYPKTPQKIIEGLNINTDQTQTSLITANRNGSNVSIVSKQLSSTLTKMLYQRLVGVGIIDLEAENPRFIRSNEDLKDSIEAWRKQLIDNLQKYLRLKVAQVDMSPNAQDFTQDLKTVMLRAWQYLQQDLTNYSDGKFDATTDSVGMERVINPILSLAVLNNFDSVIEFFSKGDINVNPQFKNGIEIYDGKYTFSQQGLQLTTWEDDFADAAVTKIIPNILKRVMEIIPNGHGDYCNIYDINSIIGHIYTLVSTEEALNPAKQVDRNLADLAKPYRILFSDSTTDVEKHEALFTILESTDFKLRFADNLKIASIVQNFRKLDEAYTNFSTSFLSEEANFSNHRNITNQLIALIRHNCTLAYARVTGNGINVNSNSGVRKNKVNAQAKIRQALRENLKDSARLGLYHPNYTLVGEAKPVWAHDDLSNTAYIDYIRKTTGHDLRVPVVQKFLHDSPILGRHVINEFLFKFNSIVWNEYNSRKSLLTSEDAWKTFIDDLMGKLVIEEEYVSFTDLITYESGQDQSLLYDLNQNPQPSQGSQATISKWTKNQMEFREQVEYLTAKLQLSPDLQDIKNVFFKYPGLRSNTAGKQYDMPIYLDPIAFRQDVLFKINNRESVVKSTKLSAEELATVGIIYEYLDNLIKEGLILTQIENVSDKGRVPLGQTNGNAVVEVKYTDNEGNSTTTKKVFKHLPIKALKQMYFNQTSWYYQVLEKSIIKDYVTIFTHAGWDLPVNPTLDDCIKVLEQHTLDDLRAATRSLFYKKDAEGNYLMNPDGTYVEGTYIELQPFIHYDPSHKSDDKKLRFNNVLYTSIQSSRESEQDFFEDLVSTGVESMIQFAKESDLPIPLSFRALDETQVEKIRKILNLPSDAAIGQWLQGGKVWNDSYEDISRALIEYFVVTSNMLADADLQLTGKFQYLHKTDTETAPQYSLEELKSMDRATRVQHHLQDLSNRGKVARKRYATLTSLYEPLTPKAMYGPGEYQRIAYISPHETMLFNQNGDAPHKQPTNDGAIFGNGISDVIEAWGYEGKDYHTNSQKLIGIIPTFANMHFIKCAKYSINNERMRSSFDQPVDNHHYNFILMFKKMNNTSLPAGFLEAWAADNEKFITNDKIWKVINGQLAYFNEASLTVEGNKVSSTWVLENGTQIDTDPVEINTVYDLWLYFGGCDSYSVNRFGKLAPSEISIEATSLLVCKYGKKLKERIISKLIDTESAKEGQVNVNSVEEVANPDTPLLYQIVKTSRFGVQNDYTHEGFDSDIPMLTQAVQALALNGRNPKLAQAVFQELKAIVEDSLVSVEDYFDTNTRDKFKKRLVEQLAQSLASNNVTSTAVDIVEHTMQRIQEWVKNGNLGPMPQLPFSDRNVFSKITSDMLVRLNSNGIKQRLSGIAVIQNPSHGVYGVYESANGEIYTREDLRLKSGNYDHRAYLSSAVEFQDQKLDLTSMYTIGDVVKYQVLAPKQNPTDPDVWEFKEVLLSTPHQLWQIESMMKEGKEVYKVPSAKRDLKTRQVTFDIQASDVDGNLLYDEFGNPIIGASFNLWNLRSTKLRLISTCSELSKDYTTVKKDKFKLLQAIQEYDPAAMEEYKRFGLTETATLAYYRANNEGLAAEENPYVYLTYEDYLLGENGRTYVLNVKAEAGEQVIPNKYKLEYGIEDSLAKVLYSVDDEGRHNYFDKILYKKLQKVHTEQVSKGHFGATLTTNEYELFITNEDIDEALPVSLKEENETTYITNTNGDALFEAPKGNYKLAVSRLSNGKILYKVQVENQKQAELIINKVRDVNLYYNERGLDYVEKYNKQNGVSFNPNNEKELQKYILSQSNAVYNSFVLTLNTISTRIPSQSWPSFQATKTVAFTDNDLNDGYMNIWEMWFQGSDFDIDKAYTMMYSVDRFGRIEGNGFIDYSSPESIQRSLRNSLMSKQNKKVEFIPAWSNTDIDLLPKKLVKYGEALHWDPDTEIANITIEFDEYTSDEIRTKYEKFVTDTAEGINITLTPGNIDELVIDFPSKKELIYSTIIEQTQGIKGLISVNTASLRGSKALFAYYTWMRDINKFNRRNLIGFRQNRIMQRMWDATTSMLNFEAATKPMDAGLVNNEMDAISKDKVTNNEFDPSTKYKMQFNAQMGKDDVGGAANGIKADGGLQHHITYQSLLQTAASLYTPNVKLHFDYEGRTIGDFHLFKVANVNISKDNFDIMIDRMYADPTEVLDNPIIRSLKVSTLADGQEYFDKDGNKLSFYRRAAEAFMLWSKGEVDIRHITPDQAKDFLYYFSSFEDNAADILSVLISLATDNAKELRLASLNAPIDLISVPLALTIYGVNVRQMVDICMHVLKPVLKQMTQNRFKTDYKDLKVKDAIDECRKKKLLSNESADSLLKVVRLASELRFLTSFYKINQGAETNLIDLQRWISGVTLVKTEFEKEYQKDVFDDLQRVSKSIDAIRSTYVIDLQPYVKSLIAKSVLKTEEQITEEDKFSFLEAVEVGMNNGESLPLDFERLFDGDKDYKNSLIQYFNMFSTGFNVIDVVLNSPSYFSQLQAVARNTSIFGRMICTSALSNALIKKNPNKSISDHKVKMLFGDLATSLFVKKLTDFKFNKTDIEEAFKGQVVVPGAHDSSFDLTTNTGVSLFMSIVKNGLIPKLRTQYASTNFFISSLSEKLNRNNGMSYITLPFNQFANKDEEIEKSYIAEAKVQFGEIMKLSSGLVNSNGKDLPIGEVLYVYNLIATGGSMNPLTTCAQLIRDGGFSALPDLYESIVEDLDRRTEVLNGELESATPNDDEVLNSDLITKLDLIFKALESTTKSYSTNGVTFSLQSQWLLTNVLYSTTLTEGQVINEIKALYPQVKSIEFTKVDDVSNQMRYVAKLEYTINDHTIYDQIEGLINTDNDQLTSYTIERMKFDLHGKIKYAENVLGIDSDVQSITSNQSIQQMAPPINPPSTTTQKVLKLIPSNLQVEVIKANRVEEPYSITFNGKKYLIVPNEINYDYNSPGMINALLGLSTSGTLQDNLKQMLSLYTNGVLEGEANLTAALRRLFNDPDLLDKTTKEFRDYIDWVLTEQTSASVKERIQLQLEAFSEMFTNEAKRSFFFSENAKGTELNTGDIFQVFDETHIYLGMDKGRYITCSLGESSKPRISYTNPNKAYPKLFARKRSTNENLGKLKRGAFVYEQEVDATKKPFSALVVGDIVVINKLEWFVSEVLVTGDNQFEFIVECNGKYLSLTEDKLNGIDYQTKTPKSNKILGSTKHVFEGNDGVKFDIPNDYQFSDQQFISTPTTSGYFTEKHGDSKIIIATETGQQIIDISDITSIVSDGRKLDAELTYLANPVVFYASDSTIGRFKNLYKYNPAKWLKSSQQNITNIKTGQLKAVNRYTSPDGVINLPYHYNQVELSNYQKGDIVKVAIGYMRVLECKNGYIFGILDNGVTQEYTVEATSMILQHFKPKSQSAMYLRPTAQLNMSDFLAGRRILETIRTRFNTDIEIDSDVNNTHFAYVKDGKVYINTARLDAYNNSLAKSGRPKVSLEQYIVLQGVHEFAHLMLTQLQAMNGELYYLIINAIKNMEKSSTLWNEINSNSEYSSDIAKYEEFIVRSIENKFRQNLDALFSTTDVVLEYKLNQLLQQGFGVFANLNSLQLGASMKASLLDFQKDVFGYTTQDTNIEFLRQNSLNADVLSNIYCK